jgi:uncharacterized protein
LSTDLSFLDRPEVLEIVFPVVYSPFLPDDVSFLPPPEPTYTIEVEEGVKIVCGYWVAHKGCPSILYFHGNGETVGTCDWIAPLYNEKKINFFVADYRGYGSSNGKPTISNMISDAHLIFAGFKEIVGKQGNKNSLFVMGRSLGSIPAIEVASHYQSDIRGLIVESGMANNFRRLWEYLRSTEGAPVMGEESPFLNKVKIRQVIKPTLIIHGEYDQLIPVREGEELYRNSGAEKKSILIVPEADHNDVMIVKQSLYFDTIAEFVSANG